LLVVSYFCQGHSSFWPSFHTLPWYTRSLLDERFFAVVFAGVDSPGVVVLVVAAAVVGGTVFPAASKASAEAIYLACCFFNFAAAFLAFFSCSLFQ
jgi:hypothetical protein